MPLPITGYYLAGQYVFVKGECNIESLKLLGNYGISLDYAGKKDESRRGPVNRRLVALGFDGESGDEKCPDDVIVLNLCEAFFLAHGLGCLCVAAEANQLMSIVACWDRFRNYYKESNIQLDFAVEYGVYHYFRSRGWIVKSGDNYGANFLLYREDPSTEHARYAVLIVIDDGSSSSSRDWGSLLTFHRVIQSVSKELLLAMVVLSDKPNFSTPQFLSDMKIGTIIFSGQSNKLTHVSRKKV